MHGGDIYSNKVKFDFSVNTNPLGMPDFIKREIADNLDKMSNYPDYENRALRKAIGDRLNVDMDYIVCGNGASELINTICIYLSKKKGKLRALLQSPCFSGYERALRAADASIDYYLDLKELKRSDDIDLVFITNPANPSGKLTSKDELLDFLDNRLSLDTIVVLDECFIELCDRGEKNSLIDKLKYYPNLVIIRAFTKSYALAGIRLGYLMCENDSFIKGIKNILPEWNINAIATMAGLLIMNSSKDDYIKDSLRLICKGRSYLSDELKRLGFKPFPSDCNFILFKDNRDFFDERSDLYNSLLKREILIRDCSDFKGLGRGYYRIAVKSMDENKILISNIESILGKNDA